jgi:DNA polymerase (family X)
MERVIRHAKDRGRFMELDGQPDRLDLSDEHCRMAREMGVMVSVDSDAHSVLELEFARGGVRQARRGWLEPRHVLNARPLEELRRILHNGR